MGKKKAPTQKDTKTITLNEFAGESAAMKAAELPSAPSEE
tara:strand:+ start:394 stop:513 length:120 start_codon:yes stop_codon:yes gene_type:complete